ncbi:hypothetical protein KKA85_14755 [bacterium]|nr:hypothetical protein [bacterium]
MSKRIITLLPAALMLLAATIVWADVGPPVKVTLLGDPRPAVKDEVFAGVLALDFDGDVAVRDFVCEGKSWTTVTLSAPASARGAKGERIEIEFAALAGDPDQPLVISFDAGGFPYRVTLDLSQANYLRTQRPEPTVAAPKAQVVTGKRPLGELGPATVSPDAETVPSGDKALIRIRGRFGYPREDAVWVGAHSMRVRVYDYDSSSDDELLGSGWTDYYGYYDFYVEGDNAGAGDTPDIYVLYDTFNYKIEVQDPTYGNLYAWVSGTFSNYTGTDLDLGWLQPASEGDHPAVHLHTTTTRVFNFCNWEAGYNPDSIDVLWPDGADGAWYNAAGIHMSSGLQWQEQVPAHEYGHYWDDTYSGIEAFDYCNGWCDNPSCGHCIWCEESGVIAWMEGWANFFSDAATHTFLAAYGLEPMYQMEFESVLSCGGYGFHDAAITEGFAAALLHDIYDDNTENDPQFPDWSDMTTLWIEEIFATADYDNPDGPMDFLDSFNARYPSLKEWVWQTAANNGYDPDYANPGIVTGLTSTSHSTSGDSPDPTIDFVWTRATDDVSGVNGYGIFISGAPGMPSTDMDIGNVTSYTTASLSPGTYYFNIRAVDRSGKWSGGYASYGPITIRAAEPADITYYQHPGWDYVIVPRSTTGATTTDAHLTTWLYGASTSTYWSIYGRNAGDQTTSSGFHGDLLTDGAYTAGVSWGPISGGGLFVGTNMGPLYYRGGRHIMSFHYDDNEQISESDETNNLWGHPFVWTPWTLNPNSFYTINAYPDADGGWDTVVDGSTLWYNCDGTRFSSSAWWNAVILWADDDTDNYDVRIHVPSTGPENGFGSYLAASYRSTGLLDGCLVNRNVVGTNDYDVGMLNRFEGDSPYHIEHVTSGSVSFDDSLTVTLGANKMLQMWEFYVGVDDTGYVSITVDVDPADGPLTALWLDEFFEVGSLSSYDAADVTDAVTGRARLDLHIGETGFNCLAVYREPVDGRTAIDYTIEIQTTPPDFICYEAAGWHSPLVARPADDGTPGSVALPDTLYGNVASTYMNVATRNESPTGSTSLYAQFFIDNVVAAGLSWGSFPGYANSLFNWDYPLNVRGGRHTFSVRHDPNAEIEEIYEDNNDYGEQYVWGPLSMSGGTQVARTAPPEMMGGWDDMLVGPYWYNCDGLRLGYESWWMSMAVMPVNTGDDTAVRVHDALPGAKDGFAGNHAVSNWGSGQSDFVLVNYNNLAYDPKDFGVLRYSGTGNYVAEASASTYFGTPPNGANYGPYTMSALEIVDLYEFNLTPGFYVVRVQNVSGTVDWGMSMYGPASEYVAKSGNIPDGAAWYEGAGGDESISFEVVDAGYHCLAVWKAHTDDLYGSGSYRLRIWNGMTAVEDELPPVAVTCLASVQPNPFNPRTTIAYELARETAVDLSIFDVQGSLVRTLVRASLPAGPHAAVWDGTDDHGQHVASDVYLVRLRAGDADQMRKIVLLK